MKMNFVGYGKEENRCKNPLEVKRKFKANYYECDEFSKHNISSCD